MSMYFLYIWGYLYVCVCTHRNQKRRWDLQELQLQMSCPTWMLGAKLRFYVKELCSLNHETHCQVLVAILL